MNRKRTPRTLLPAILLAIAACLPLSALAQGTIVPEATAEAPAAESSASGEPSATASASASAQPAPTATASAAPVVAPPVPAVAPTGEWVYTDTYGWIWVPAGATTVLVQEQPYVYLYTPAYGWTWYGSPWGPGAYYVGPWVHHGWAPARVWHRGGWYAPHVVVRPRPAPLPVRGGVRGGGGGRRGGHR